MEADAREVGDRLASLYRNIQQDAMRDAPICNDALEVEALGFRDFMGWACGVIVTPWFANLVVAPRAELALAPGVLSLRFPAGEVDFRISDLAGFGRLGSCSLFSPMSDFANQEALRAAARAALEALFDSNLHAAPYLTPQSDGRLDRRAFFGARRREEAAP